MTLSLIQNGVPDEPQDTQTPTIVVRPNTLNIFQDTSSVYRRLAEYDDAYCTIAILRGEAPRELIDYVLLQSCTEVYLDRLSPTYTFGAPMIHTSGVDARQFVYTAYLVPNEREGDFAARFIEKYETLLRASSLIKYDERGVVVGTVLVELTYRDQVRRGYITSLSSQRDSQLPNAVAITFSMFVIDQYTAFTNNL